MQRKPKCRARGCVLHRPRGAQSTSEKVWQRLAKPARGSEFRAISLGTMVLLVRWVKRCKKNWAQCSPNSSCSSFFNRRSNLLNAIITQPLAPILEEEAHSFASSVLDPENRFATAAADSPKPPILVKLFILPRFGKRCDIPTFIIQSECGSYELCE